MLCKYYEFCLLVLREACNLLENGFTKDIRKKLKVRRYRPPDKSGQLKIIFLISQPKHMLWVLKRTVSMRRFF